MEDYSAGVKEATEIKRRKEKNHYYNDAEKKYMKRLRNEGASYDEIKKRFKAEYGIVPSNGVVWRYIHSKRRKKAIAVKPVAVAKKTVTMKYCSNCGVDLRRHYI